MSTPKYWKAKKLRKFSQRSKGLRRRRLAHEHLEERRVLATFTVTDLALDSGPGSLRQAILDANSGGDPVDDIVFAAGLTGNVTLTSGEIPITSSLNITGPGADVITVSGNDSSRVFNIDDSIAGNLLEVVVDGLTLTGGSATGAGGAILSQENLTLRNAIVSGSTATGNGGGVAVYSGTATIESSTLDGNTATAAVAHGGGLFSNSPIFVAGSTLSNNLVIGVTDGTNSIDIRGGAISGTGEIAVSGSTINNNRVSFEQQSTTGTVAVRGGGISGAGDQVAILSSTINNNIATMQGFYSLIESVATADVLGGGVQTDSGNITITGSTIRDNGASLEFFNVSSGAASLEGGGIRTASGQISVVDSQVRSNRLRLAGVTSNTGLSVEGGGIRNASGPITVTDSLITGNRAASSQASTTATLRVEGGGIRNDSNVSILRSKVSQNYLFEGYGAVTGTTTVEGGGVWGNTGVVAIDNATISDNRMRTNRGLGAGVHLNSSPGSLTINSSTISGNVTRGSGAGISVEGGTLNLSHSTVAFNQADYEGTTGGQDGGGILIGPGGGTPLLRHTIVAQNLVDTATDDVAGTLDAASRFNLIGNGDGAVGISNGINGNQVGSTGTEIDPLLGPLKNNGGPTETHVLLAGSPALDAGDPAFAGPPNSDQRLAPFARVADGGIGLRIDIGAYERQTLSFGPLVVTTADDEFDEGFDANDLSLREAISIANGSIGADTITFDTAGVFSTPQTIALVASLGEMPISDAVTITGPGSDMVTIDAQRNSRIFNISDANRSTLLDVEIDGLTLTNGYVPQNSSPSGGGAIVTSENLTLRNSALTNNTAFSGGALLALTEAFESGSSAQITVEDSVLTGNVARVSAGGAISINGDAVGDNSSSTTLINNVVLSGNTSNRDGGAIYLRVDNSGVNTTVSKTVRNVTITGNASGGSGGGISDDSDTASSTGAGTNTLTIEDSNIVGNMADNDGGGIDLDMSPFNPGNEFAVNITRVNISGNTAGVDVDPFDVDGGNGGGIYNTNDADELNTSSTLTITDSTISGNTALRGSLTFQGIGGGVYSGTTADDVNSVESVVIRNTAIFNNNAATSGGGLYLKADPSTVEPTATNTTTITSSTIHNNTAMDAGGGIYSVMNASGAVTITNTTISGNNTNGVDAPGGGIYNANKNGGLLAINSSTITNNSSGGNGVGGGLYNFNDGVDGAGASGLTTLHNTILAGNVAGGGSDPDVATTSLAGAAASIDARFSIIGDVGTATVNDLGGNQIGSFGSLVDPRLGPLANNGGPTLTHALLPASPALDAGGAFVVEGLLFNTGVDSQGNTLGDSVDDPHYTLFSQPGGGSLTDATVPEDGFPIPPWLPNEADSRWIGPATADAEGPAGEYVYRTTFDLSGFDFASSNFQITGRWASDNTGTDILINGVSTGQSNLEFTAYTPFTIDTGFVPGVNTLDFVVQNSGIGPSPAGLRVDNIQVVANRVNDQRGFTRTVDLGGIPNPGNGTDIGAYEAQGVPTAAPGDYNRDGTVNLADYTVWRNSLGASVAPLSSADGDGNGMVDSADYQAWRSHFGFTYSLPLPPDPATIVTAPADDSSTATDAAFASFASPIVGATTSDSPSTTVEPSATEEDDLLLLLRKPQGEEASIGQTSWSIAEEDEVKESTSVESLELALGEWG